jgi:hypothetical protein
MFKKIYDTDFKIGSKFRCKKKYSEIMPALSRFGDNEYMRTIIFEDSRIIDIYEDSDNKHIESEDDFEFQIVFDSVRRIDEDGEITTYSYNKKVLMNYFLVEKNKRNNQI